MDGETLIAKMVDELKLGVDIETVIDRHVTFKTPELRRKFIEGLARIVKPPYS